MSVLEIIKLIFEILKLVVAAWEYISGAIDEHQYNAKVNAIKAAIKKTDSENEDEQLEGGGELEDSFGGPNSGS